MTGNEEVRATAQVRALADRLGVHLAAATGTGVGGRITTGDVRNAARRQRAERTQRLEQARAEAPTAQPGSLSATGRPTVMSWLRGENAAVMCASPEVRQLADERGVRMKYVHGTGPDGRTTVSDVLAQADRQDAGRRRAQIAAATPADTRVPEWPLPAFTASGVDPFQLLAVPEPVRPAMAAADTLAAAYRIKNNYAGLSDEDARQQLMIDKDVLPEHGGWCWPTDTR